MTDTPAPSIRLAVLGAGISGLVAAYRLRRLHGDEAHIVLVDAANRPGGQLYTVDLADGPFDVGAEAFVTRRPEVPALLAELGLADLIEHPGDARPSVWAGGALHALPAGTLMGIPASGAALGDLVDAGAAARVDAERDRPLRWEVGSDPSIGALVGDRFGRAVVDRSVDPLLGGVYSGRADGIGVRAALPTLAAALDAGAGSLIEAVERAMPPTRSGPVFGSVRGGYRVLVDALLAAADVDLVLGRPVGPIGRVGGRWSVDPVGDVDGIVVALPAPEAAEALHGVAPEVSVELARIERAAAAVVALAIPDDPPLPHRSGVLVAADEPLQTKAFTFSSVKWPARGRTVLRASLGRADDAAVVEAADEKLIDIALADLETVTGLRVQPHATLVHRWRAGIPQYAPGHAALIAEVDRRIADLPGLTLAGAYRHGVGVAACVADAERAARRARD
ncbi:protoporphyrinogen oxidase [Millisia brevis]|uniref:protoporphyrinogen oxidase n=1 Tax=Millisia brevis TaxID=264148 RepID=UPI00082B92DF|nr:protoporphyrinogen oxidase [Millisia brevis]